MTRLLPSLILVLFTVALPARAAVEAGPLVTADWLAAHADAAGVKILDVRGAPAFAKGHVPGAVVTDYGRDGWRIKSGDVPGMLPPVAQLEALIGGLGISNADHVVIVPQGASATEIGVATRIYWTFKAMGHGAVSILDGGFASWAADPKRPVSSTVGKIEPAAFTATPDASVIANADDVRAAAAGGAQLIDNRPQDQHLGVTKSDVATRYGAVPGSANAPAMWATVDDGGTFRSADQLRALYQAAGVPTDGDVINYCNTGHWASVGWFVSSELLGNDKAKMYDGSMAEWSRVDDAPMQSLVKRP